MHTPLLHGGNGAEGPLQGLALQVIAQMLAR